MKSKLFIFLALLTTLLSTTAGAHTFGVGLRASDSGAGVEVYYRAWHNCAIDDIEDPNFEGLIRIEGIDGTSYGPIESVATLTSCDGEVSTFPTFEPTNIGYYCEVDALGNIIDPETGGTSTTAVASFGYDPLSPVSLEEMNEDEFGSPDAVGAILCNEPVYNFEDASPEDKWQGATFDNLPTGRYRISYVPCDADGDPSDCADGVGASDAWDPDRNLVLDAEVTISGGPTGIPTLPFYGLFILAGLLGIFGILRVQR